MKDVLRAYTPQFFGIVKAPDAEDSDDCKLFTKMNYDKLWLNKKFFLELLP